MVKVKIEIVEEHPDPERPQYPQTSMLARIEVEVIEQLAWAVYQDALASLRGDLADEARPPA